MKYLRVFFLFCALLFFCIPVSQSIEQNMKLDALDIFQKCELLAGPAAQKSKVFDVIVFLSGEMCGDTSNYLKMLEECSDLFQYSGKKVQCSLVFFNTKAEMISVSQEKHSVSLFWDKDGQIEKNYIHGENQIPFAVVISNGVVQWKGHPVEQECVLPNIISGNFSRTDQKKFADAFRDLQTAIQTRLPDVILHNADRMLDLQPGNLTAVQAKLFVYENLGKYQDMNDFLQKQIALCPNIFYLRIFALNTAVALNDKIMFRDILLKTWQCYKDKPVYAARVIFYAIGKAPFAWLPYPEMLTIMESLRTVSQTMDADVRAQVYEFSARIFFLCGDLQSAVHSQKEALSLRSDQKEKSDCTELLDYYEKLQKLRKHGNGK